MSGAALPGHSRRLHYRSATLDDVSVLAAMNRQLIVDEGHSNPMAEAELAARMREWLEPREYEATMIGLGASCIGYSLWQRQECCLYVRHFIIVPEYRRQGYGREAMAWMRQHLWNDKTRIRLDVLVDNARGIGFWRALGFEEYCLTLELRGSVQRSHDIRWSED